MLQRRCLEDDHKGVGQVLNQTYHTEPQIMILIDNDENIANFNRRYYQIQQFSNSFFFTLTDSINSWTSKYNTSWTAINPLNPDGLPQSLFIQQLRYIYSGNSNNSGIIFQIQNMFQNNESSQAKNVSIDLSSIFNPSILNIKQSTEMNLFGTIPLANMHRLPWNVKDKNGNIQRIRDEKYEQNRRELQKIKDQSPIINLSPRDLKTYLVNSVPVMP